MAGWPLQPILVEHRLGGGRLAQAEEHRHTDSENAQQLRPLVERQVRGLKQRGQGEKAVGKVVEDERGHAEHGARHSQAQF